MKDRLPRHPRRGPIEAALPARWDPEEKRCLPRHPRRGPIEALNLGAIVTAGASVFRDTLVAAPLKRLAVDAEAVTRRGLPRHPRRGPIEASSPVIPRATPARLPRHPRRGPIEARQGRHLALRAERLPRHPRRGPIEARPRSWAFTHRPSVFRDTLVAAPLKHRHRQHGHPAGPSSSATPSSRPH